MHDFEALIPFLQKPVKFRGKYLKHVLSPHFKWLLLTTKLVSFPHSQHCFAAKFPDDLVKGASERTEVWVSFGTKAKHRISKNWELHSFVRIQGLWFTVRPESKAIRGTILMRKYSFVQSTKSPYYVAGSASGQDEANPVYWLATRKTKMGLPCPTGISRFGAPRTIISWPYEWILSLSSLFGQHGWILALSTFCVFIDIDEPANIQPSWTNA